MKLNTALHPWESPDLTSYYCRESPSPEWPAQTAWLQFIDEALSLLEPVMPALVPSLPRMVRASQASHAEKGRWQDFKRTKSDHLYPVVLEVEEGAGKHFRHLIGWFMNLVILLLLERNEQLHHWTAFSSVEDKNEQLELTQRYGALAPFHLYELCSVFQISAQIKTVGEFWEALAREPRFGFNTLSFQNIKNEDGALQRLLTVA